MEPMVRVRARVPGVVSAAVETVGPLGRRAVVARIDPKHRHGALAEADSETLAAAARLALDARFPLVGLIASSGTDVDGGVGALHGWGLAARGLAACSGVVPILIAVVGPAVSGPALLLGMADVVVMSPTALAYVSGPAMVAQMTGLRLGPGQLGGSGIHARATGVAALHADDSESALELLAETLDYLPDHTDAEAAVRDVGDPPDRAAPELTALIPSSPSGSYDVRTVIGAITDGGGFLELRSTWAPQLVTALARLDGRSVGFIANQPGVMAGTLDIAASQKGARFVAFCDTFNLPLVTLVDTPGFMPGKDLEWRGMIRHGAQLVFAFAEATVPRVSVILRKGYGGAYIVMDSKRLGNDLCLAWPGAEVAVMGAEPAAQVLHRRAEPDMRARAADDFRDAFLNPYVAAERGYVDEVIDPAETRSAVVRALRLLAPKRERLPARKHGNTPL
jgi:acetyl-CoA carboxylase carboxyltransferase component